VPSRSALSLLLAAGVIGLLIFDGGSVLAMEVMCSTTPQPQASCRDRGEGDAAE
jgi:hypothetical protein